MTSETLFSHLLSYPHRDDQRDAKRHPLNEPSFPGWYPHPQLPPLEPGTAEGDQQLGNIGEAIGDSPALVLTGTRLSAGSARARAVVVMPANEATAALISGQEWDGQWATVDNAKRDGSVLGLLERNAAILEEGRVDEVSMFVKYNHHGYAFDEVFLDLVFVDEQRFAQMYGGTPPFPGNPTLELPARPSLHIAPVEVAEAFLAVPAPPFSPDTPTRGVVAGF